MRPGEHPAAFWPAAADHDWVRAARIGNDVLGQPGHVVEAKDGGAGRLEGQIDQSLVPGCLADLGRASAWPDWLADKPDWLAGGTVDECLDRWHDPRRVAAELEHVGKDRWRGGTSRGHACRCCRAGPADPGRFTAGRMTLAERQPHPLLLHSWHGDHGSFVRRGPSLEEVGDGVRVVVQIAIEQREVP